MPPRHTRESQYKSDSDSSTAALLRARAAEIIGNSRCIHSSPIAGATLSLEKVATEKNRRMSGFVKQFDTPEEVNTVCARVCVRAGAGEGEGVGVGGCCLCVAARCPSLARSLARSFARFYSVSLNSVSACACACVSATAWRSAWARDPTGWCTKPWTQRRAISK